MDGSDPPEGPAAQRASIVATGSLPTSARRWFRATMACSCCRRAKRTSTIRSRPKGFGYANPLIHKWYSCGPPDGFPKAVASCQDQDPPLSTGIASTDSIALELEIRTPANAHGFSFEHYYMLASWPFHLFRAEPSWRCSSHFKQQFDGNIVFDATGDYIGQPATIPGVWCENGPPCPSSA
jgi:hypothetical protein